MFFDRVKKAVLIAILLALTGGHWAVLQSAAWAGMLVSHLRTESLSTAMVQTFDGNHPCPLCKAIAAGKKSEQKSELESKVVRIEFLPADLRCLSVKDDSLRFAVCPVNESAESIALLPRPRPPCLNRV